MPHWQKVLVWIAGAALVAGVAFIAAIAGGIDVDVPDPPLWQDVLGGIIFGLVLNAGLLISPLAVRRSRRFRATTMALMVPMFAAMTIATLEFVARFLMTGRAPLIPAVVNLVGAAAYGLAFLSLRRAGRPEVAVV